MNIMYTVLAAVILGAIALAAILFLRRDSPEGSTGAKKRPVKTRDRQTILREANRRLAQNSRDPLALLSLADLHFQEQSYDKAFNFYKMLLPLCATVPDLNEFEITLHYAQCALKVKNLDEAYKHFMIARTLNEEDFEVNYNLGYLEFSRKNFNNAAAYLNRAKQNDPDHVSTNRYLGHSLFRIKMFKEAVLALRKTLEIEPEDKKTLFVLGQTYFEMGSNDLAKKIFTQLRTDPTLGPNAALYSGTILNNQKQYQEAALDFEIGLKHENVPKEVGLELKYRLATALLGEGNLDATLKLWGEIVKEKKDYKDVRQKLKEYQEISNNQNLQIFLLAPRSEFVTLCRKIASKYFERANTKLVDISQKNDYVDILAEIHTSKWDDLVLYRFVRGSGQVGELMLRELYSRIKDLKAGRGICLTSGSFSESARSFVEARLIDLVEKTGLMKIFDRI